MKGSVHYDKKIVCCVLTIAQYGKYYVADPKGLVPARRLRGKMGPLIVEDDIEEGTMHV